MLSRTELAQQILKEAGLYAGKIDGDAGSKTLAALNVFPGMNTAFSVKRKIVACIQLACSNAGFNPGPIDGYWGPSTDYAVTEYLYFKEHQEELPDWRPEEIVNTNPNNWPQAYTPDFDTFYGPVGDRNLTRITLPYAMKIAWNTNQKVTTTLCHKNVSDSALRVFEAVLQHYGLDEIKRLRLDYFGGCYNKRQIRGGSKWSLHSWGVAFDFDPLKNQLMWGRDKAAFAQPEYDPWWYFWEREGWVSLGRQRNFDWMHVQAALL